MEVQRWARVKVRGVHRAGLHLKLFKLKELLAQNCGAKAIMELLVLEVA